MIDAPFDIRKYRFTVKPEKRVLPAVGQAILIESIESSRFKVLVDGSGLNHNDIDRLVEHSTHEADMWITQTDQLGEGIVIDLPGERMLGSIAVWNYNKPAYTDMGVQTMDISVWTAGRGWQKILKKAVLEEAEGTYDYDAPTLLTFDPVSAEKVRFENLTAFNPKAGQIGLSELAFYEPLGLAACNPEPADGGQIACLDAVPLVWMAGRSAIAHDVYLGESGGTLVHLGRIKGAPQVKVSGLSPETDYLWRIDEVGKDGSVEQGPPWTFHTRGQQIGHWRLDETADDASGRYSGTIQGNPTWQAGHKGRAIHLDGDGDCVLIPAPNLNTDAVTICGWINADEQTSSIPGIVFCRTGRTVAGIHLLGTDLRYHWNDLSATYDWSSGLTVPQDQWVFAALTVTPDKGTLYLYDGEELRSSENPVLHTTEEFDGPLYIGRDPQDDRDFKGAVDEVRVYDFALSRAQIEAIARDQEVDFSKRGDIRLVDADLVTEGQSIQEIAAEAEQAASTEEKKATNLIPVAVIVLIVIVIAALSMLKKKK